MSLITVKVFLHSRRGYLKKSPSIVAEILDEDIETCKQARLEVLKEVKLERVLKSLNEAPIAGSDIGFKRLFFDIETSMYIVGTWRIGYNVRLSYDQVLEDSKVICISYKWENEDTVHTLAWDENLDDKQLLKDFVKIAAEADELIAHNGDKFDIKMVRTRCAYHEVPAFPKYRTLDTLKKAKDYFKFPDNKLNTIAQFFGVGEKEKHDGVPLWLGCMDGDEKSLKEMIKYCEKDVIVLEDVYHKMQNYIKHNTHVGIHTGSAAYSCPSCGHNAGFTLQRNDVTPAGTIKRIVQCNECEYVYEMSNKKYMTQ